MTEDPSMLDLLQPAKKNMEDDQGCVIYKWILKSGGFTDSTKNMLDLIPV